MPMSPYFRDLRTKVGDGLLVVPGVAAIIHDAEGRLLLHQRPDLRWNLPGGAIEPGENPASAIVREIREETGLDATPVRILAVLGGDGFRVFYRNGDAVEYCVTIFECTVVPGERPFEANEESLQVRYFAEAEAPPLGLPFSRELLFGRPGCAQFDPPREQIEDPKGIVAAGYDAIAVVYAAARATERESQFDRLAERLVPPCRSLDIGCGAGVPVMARLAGLGSVVGVDISRAQLDLARGRVPAATLIHGDIMEQEFPDRSFDAITLVYTLFHLPRSEQRELLRRAAGWLRPGGHLFATLASSDRPGYTESDFFGVTMYWSHFSVDWYTEQLERVGFEILHLGEVGHGYGAGSGFPAERHPSVLARRRAWECATSAPSDRASEVAGEGTWTSCGLASPSES